MTTIAQLAQSAKGRLIPYLESKGFKHYGKLAFAREIGDGVHQVISAELSYGENLKFNVRCFVEEYGPKYMEKYPFNIPITCGGRLGEEPVAGEIWEVRSLDGIEDVWADVIRNVEDYALPWFDKVNNRQAFVEVLYPHLREKLEARGELNAVLNGKT